MDSQAKLTDLVPKRYATILLLFMAGVATVVGLEALYAWMPQLSALSSDGRIAAFDLDGEGSLAMWFSSATLAVAGLVSLLIYHVRRHRLDDYHGRYRIWLWATAAWFLMSIDEGGSLHEGFKELMTVATGHRLFGDGSIWWVSAYLVVLGTIGLRVVLDIRECRAAMVAMLGVAICYASAVFAQLEWILPRSGSRGVMLEEGCEMVGNLLLLLSLVFYARHVILDAQGVLPSPAKANKPNKKEDAKAGRSKAGSESAADSAATKRHDLAPVAKSAAPAGRTAKHVADDDDDYDDEEELDDRDQRKSRTKHRLDDAEDQAGDRKLNKTDRKTLRRHKEQHRRGDLG